MERVTEVPGALRVIDLVVACGAGGLLAIRAAAAVVNGASGQDLSWALPRALVFIVLALAALAAGLFVFVPRPTTIGTYGALAVLVVLAVVALVGLPFLSPEPV